jgi:hypothetical protein
MTILATFDVPVTFSLSPDQLKEAREALNTHHLGDPECNFLDKETMRYMPKYPEKETAEFKESMSAICRNYTNYITVVLDSSGRLSIL